jgi:hypothetical protein
LNEKEKALGYLSDYNKSSWAGPFIEIYPSLENLRNTPEFLAIVKRI